MHETKQTALRTMTPNINEPSEEIIESNTTSQGFVKNTHGVSPDHNISPSGMEMENPKSPPELAAFGGTFEPKNNKMQSLSPDTFSLRTPLKTLPSTDENDLNQTPRILQDLTLEKPTSLVVDPQDRLSTSLPISKEKATTMSPAERMGYIRTVVDDVDDDFMSSSINSISRSSSFSTSRVSLALARRSYKLHSSAGTRGAAGGRGQYSTPIYPSGLAGGELVDYLMSVATGDGRGSGMGSVCGYINRARCMWLHTQGSL